jgi:inorganic pyrophosphatase
MVRDLMYKSTLEPPMTVRTALILLAFPALLAAQLPTEPPDELPAVATTQLARSLAAAKPRARHLWRDTMPVNADGTVNAYVEIARGDRRKWEFDMRAHQRAIDRVIPEAIGGFPVNYGFVPQTVSYDGDPFDALVLGPPVEGGSLVRGVIVGLMLMEDEKGLDSKVALSPVDSGGRARYPLADAERDRIGAFFDRYKEGQPGLFSRVPGWGTAAGGLAYVRMTHVFFLECRARAGTTCIVRSVRLQPDL